MEKYRGGDYWDDPYNRQVVGDIEAVHYVERELLIEHAKATLKFALKKDIEQHQNIGNLKVFEHYVLEYPSGEESAQNGLNFARAMGVRLVEGVDAKGQPIGDEMNIRMVVPDEMRFGFQTTETDLDNWLHNVNEIYVRYTSNVDGLRSSEIYRVLPEGLQVYVPLRSEQIADEQLEQELSDFVDGTHGLPARMHKNATIINDFFLKLATFKLWPHRYSKIDIQTSR